MPIVTANSGRQNKRPPVQVEFGVAAIMGPTVDFIECLSTRVICGHMCVTPRLVTCNLYHKPCLVCLQYSVYRLSNVYMVCLKCSRSSAMSTVCVQWPNFFYSFYCLSKLFMVRLSCLLLCLFAVSSDCRRASVYCVNCLPICLMC